MDLRKPRIKCSVPSTWVKRSRESWKRTTALVALVALEATAAFAQPERDHYLLEASLNTEDHIVDGTETIRWTNRSTKAVDELWFHLYLNAFASRRTVFAVEGNGSMRGVRQTGSGRIEVTELRVASDDLLQGADFEVIPGDRTQLRIPLVTPIPPGRQVEINVRFQSHLPPLFARSGYAGSFHMVAQWFPKLAVLRADGEWETFPYHARGEFFADFSDYDLSVDAPTEVVVGATGARLSNDESSNGRRTHRFRAERVHDVAFTAWEHFLERRMAMGETRVRILYPPGYEASVEKHEAVLQEGLAHFGELFGDYPYPTLTMVVPPRGAEGAAGMEYPQIFVTAGLHTPVPGVDALDADVTAHELAHQWFQGIIATNEVEWPMLDEGLAQWATGEFARHHRPNPPLGIGFFDIMRLGAVPARNEVVPPAQPAFAFSGREYGSVVYARTAVVLETIHRTWGRRRFLRALHTYCQEHRFGHPEPDDLFGVFDRTYWPGFSSGVLVPSLVEGSGASTEVTAMRSRPQGSGYRTIVSGRRYGAVPIPVSVLLVDDQGGRHRIPWLGRTRRFHHEIDTERPVVSAVADPDGHNLLDPDPEDNRWPRQRSQDRFFLSRLLATIQTLLSVVGP